MYISFFKTCPVMLKSRFKNMLFLMCCFIQTSLFAQSYFEDGLSPAFHKERREALRKLMPDNSVAILFTNPVKMRSNDTDFTFRPNSDFYYLTGFREPNAALIVFKSPVSINGQQVDEILYVQPKDPKREQWDGERMGVEAVKSKLDFSHVFVQTEFLNQSGLDLKKFSQVLTFDYGDIESGSYNNQLKGMIAKLKEAHTTPMKLGDAALNQMMSKLRVIKQPEEIKLLTKAIDISGKGHVEAFKSIQPGTSERAIQGVHEFVHKAYGAEYTGYGSIIGAGNNSCILHYVDNSVTDLKEGVLLMDVGAEYRGYSGDITRTVPVKGVFSPEEKAVYELVLSALEAGIKACQPGRDFQEVDRAARKVIDDGLVALGITKSGERHPFFPHGIGHHLGLDVHDRGAYGKMEPGMVLTVEPGIYIPKGSNTDPKWWGIGIRIEDNILITPSGNANLSAGVPKTVAEIEKTMKEPGILQKMLSDTPEDKRKK
jgi:Xaa-Pro aminopeptidase